MEKQSNHALKGFLLSLYKIGLALKYDNKPPDKKENEDASIQSSSKV